MHPVEVILANEVKKATKYRDIKQPNKLGVETSYVGLELDGWVFVIIPKSRLTKARDFRDYPSLCEKALFDIELGDLS